MTPEENLKRKMPFDPIWQALSSPAKFQEHDKGIVDFSKKGNYNDSILALDKLSIIEKQEATMRPIKANGQFNKLVKIEYSLINLF